MISIFLAVMEMKANITLSSTSRRVLSGIFTGIVPQGLGVCKQSRRAIDRAQSDRAEGGSESHNYSVVGLVVVIDLWLLGRPDLLIKSLDPKRP